MNRNLSNLTSTFSIAGVWTPNGATDPATHNAIAIANAFYSQVGLANGRNGLVIDGWSYSGFGTTQTFYPVSAALFEQNADGTLTLATSKYLPDATTNGAGSVIVADFNGDSRQDIFLAAHNESPFIAKASTAYVSNAQGTFDKVTLNDRVEAHDAELGYLNGVPTVFTASFDGNPNPYYQYVGGQFVLTPIPGPYGTLTPQGFPVGLIGYQSIAVSDFNGDALPDAVLGDLGWGPGYPYVNGKVPLIGIYRLSDVTNSNSNNGPAALLTPYFNNKAEYAGYSSFHGPGQTHTYRVWVDDFNHDGKPDVLAGASLWPSFFSMLQTLQNTSTSGATSFTDRTAILNSGYSVRTPEVDYSMQMLDIDGSGIKTYFLAGGLAFPEQTDTTLQSNYILLNDGTGMLRVYMHDQFRGIGEQVNAYLSTRGVESQMQPRFIEYLTPDKNINLVAEVPFWASTPNGFVLQHAFVNVPLHLNPTVDFTENISLGDRNGSTLIRTWAGNDTIDSTNASSRATSIDGGLGIDTAIYSNKLSAYVVARGGDGTVAVNGSGTNDALRNVERLKFADELVAVDVDGAAGQAYRLYQAAFDRTPDTPGLSYWVNNLDHGMALSVAAASFIASNEFKAAYGDPAALSSSKFLDTLYQNILGRAPDPAGKAYWLGELDRGFARANVLASFSESAENKELVGTAIANGILLDSAWFT